VQDSLIQAVMHGISHIGVVTGQLRRGGDNKDLSEHRTQQILSLLDTAASSLKSSPEMSEADKIVSNIVAAANELVRAQYRPPQRALSFTVNTGGCYDGHSV
jgi:hypothetical protein